MDPRIASIAARLADLTRELNEILGTPLAAPAPVEAGHVREMKPEPKPLLSAKEVADLLDAHERSVRRWSLEGRIPKPVQLGRSVRWRRTELVRWLEEQDR